MNAALVHEAETDDPDLLAQQLAGDLASERAADIVDALNALEPDLAALVLIHLPLDLAIETLDTPGLDAAEIIAAFPRDKVMPYISGMSDDRTAEILRYLDKAVRDDLIAHLDAPARAALDRILSYPPDTAGSIMTTEFVTVPADWTVKQTLLHIRMVEKSRETIYSIFVVDPVTKKLLKALPLRRLISAEPDDLVINAAPPRQPVVVAPRASRDEAARLISKYDLLAVPVVDDQGYVIGIVTVDDIIDEMIQAQTDEVQRLGGSEALGEPYMDISFLGMIRKRAGWLCVLFLSEMLTATAMQGFENELEKALVLTLFIPLIMSSGGNSGSQATSLIIRALSLQEIALKDWWRVALRELPSGLLLGAILGVIGVVRITAWQLLGWYDYGPHWILVATTVGSALIGIVTFGSMSGSMLPFALQRLGFDPATASAPFVATLVDVTGIVIYFTVALVILHGTLL